MPPIQSSQILNTFDQMLTKCLNTNPAAINIPITKEFAMKSIATIQPPAKVPWQRVVKIVTDKPNLLWKNDRLILTDIPKYKQAHHQVIIMQTNLETTYQPANIETHFSAWWEKQGFFAPAGA